MQTTPSVSQVLSRAALAAIAVVVVLAAGDLSERQFGLQMPPAIKGIVLFMAFFVMNLIPFRQPNKSQQPASAPNDARA